MKRGTVRHGRPLPWWAAVVLGANLLALSAGVTYAADTQCPDLPRNSIARVFGNPAGPSCSLSTGSTGAPNEFTLGWAIVDGGGDYIQVLADDYDSYSPSMSASVSGAGCGTYSASGGSGFFAIVANGSACNVTVTWLRPFPVRVSFTAIDGQPVTNIVASGFPYDRRRPEITGISPASGPVAGGTTVTVTGNNLDRTAQLTVGNVQRTISGPLTFSELAEPIKSRPSIISANASAITFVTAPYFSYSSPAELRVSVQVSNRWQASAGSYVFNFQLPQTIAFTSPAPASPVFGGSYTVSATGGTSGNPVVFTTDASSTTGACMVAGPIVSFTGVGTCIVNANQAGAANFAAAPQVQQTMRIGPPAIVLTTTSLPFGSAGSPYSATLAASGGTGPYTFAVTGLPAGLSVNSNAITGAPTLSGNTTVQITVTDSTPAGNGGPFVSAPAALTIGIGQGSQVITYTSAPPATPVVGGTYAVTATGGASGNPVVFSIDPASGAGVCTISGSTVSFTGAGSCIVVADQAHTVHYGTAEPVQQTITVGRATQVVAITSTPPASPVAGGSYTLTATGGASGNPVTFTIDAASGAGVCSVTGSTVSFTGAGTCIASANQAGNANYDAATQALQSITVGKGAQAVAFTSAVPALPIVGGTYAVTATGGNSGNPVTVSIDAASASGACSLSGNTISFTGAGSCVVNANQAGNTNYNAAPQVQQTMTVGKASQTVAFTSTIPASPIAGGTYSVTATGGLSGNPVTFTIDAASATGACSIAGGTVNFTGAGTCIVDANQAGNANYSAASQVQQTIVIGKAAQTIAFTSTVPSSPVVGGSYAVTASGGASGNPVMFSIDPASAAGACSVSGATVGFTSAGTCLIDANQAGNANYLAAPQVQQTVVIAKATQSITFTKPADQTFGASPVALVATATSGLAVTFASTTPGVCTVSGSTAIMATVGSCSITASQAGNAGYLLAADVVQTFNIGIASQTITFTKPLDVVYAPGATASLAAFATSGLVVTFASTTPGVCTVSGATATIVAIGACSITASQAGNANYRAATDVTQSFNALGEPKITASATVSPNTFSRAGVTLVFTVTLANSSSVAATGLRLTDARLGTLTCAPAVLAAGGTVVCQGSTVTTAADLKARSITIVPQLTYSYGAPVAAAALPAQSARSASAPASITVTIALNVSVAASVDVAAVQAATKSAIQGMLSQRANVLASSGPDTARMHGRLSGGSLFGGGTETASTGSPAAGFATRRNGSGVFERYGLGGNASRGDFGTAGGGDDAHSTSPFDRFARRSFDGSARPEAAFGVPSIFQSDGSGDAPNGLRSAPLGFAFNGTADDSMGRFQFSASLSKLRAAAEAREQVKRASLDGSADAMMGLGLGPAVKSRPALFDVWLEGSSSYFRTNRPDGTRNGHAAVVSAGADMLIRAGLLVGVMAQVDWMADNSNILGQERDGRGWMAGPYMSMRLTPNLYFDARAAWGRSTNHIDPAGAYVDTFEASRALASAKLSGDWSSGAWRFRPSAEVTWFKETQQAYENAIGISIASNTFNLGRAMAGPEISYRFELEDKAILEPFVGLKGVWYFARTSETTAAGEPIGSDDLHARIEAGLTIRTVDGISLRATGAFDGIGATGYHAVQGQAKVIVPLQ